MTGDAAVALAIVSGYLLILGIGGLIADYVFPRIPILRRFAETLPNWVDED